MQNHTMAWIIPLGIVLIALEYLLSRYQGRRSHSFDTTVSNLNVGIAERVTDLSVSASFYFFYKYLYDNYAFFTISSSWWMWLILLLATDFLWYWYHRCGHKINLFWAFHIVHHSSPEFNFTAATRITVFQAAIRTLFWSVLPVIGFSPEMILTILLIHGAYPFFTHTETIGKLGWLEFILVTPSHHRVHHASNEQYIDKNFGDIFIFWDKLFGTFEPEKEPPVYGIAHPLTSKSFLWQHFHHIIEIGLGLKKACSWKERFRLVFGTPENHPALLRTEAEHIFLSKRKWNARPEHYQKYIVSQMALTLLLLFALIQWAEEIPYMSRVGLTGFILVSVINVGAILEQRRWIFNLELSRLLLLLISIEGFLTDHMIILSLTLLMIMVLAVSRDSLKKTELAYLRKIYGPAAANKLSKR